MERRVVVTGLGGITPIGNEIETFWENVKKGVNGISEITLFDTAEHKTKFAAEIKEYDPEKYFDRKEARRMDRFSQFALIAAKQAAKDSNINLKEETTINPEKVGVAISAGLGGLITIQEQCQLLKEKGPDRISPFFIPMGIANMPSGLVSIDLGIKGESFCIVTACSSSTHSIGESYRIIKHGYQDVMFAGGTEANIIDSAVAGFANMRALAMATDKNRASIPFDKERFGFVMGEGAAVLVLEELEHALKRGAKIYAEVAGFGSSSDAYHMTSPTPSGEGGARSMQNAINDAKMTKEDITYINAHGTSTPLNDKLETLAIKTVFKEHSKNLLISSTKSMMGHLLGAAGAIEAIVCVKAIQDDYVPATINLKVPDPECDLNYVPNKGIETKVNSALTNSLGFGGHNGTLIFKKYIV